MCVAEPVSPASAFGYCSRFFSGLIEDSSAVVAGNDFHIDRVVDQQCVPLDLLVFRGGQAHMATAAAEVSVGVFDMDENGEELFTEAFVVGEEAAFSAACSRSWYATRSRL